MSIARLSISVSASLPHRDLERAADEVLVMRAQRGDRQAFDMLMRRHEERIYNVALGILRNPRDAEDAAQEAFLNAFRKLHLFRGDSRFTSWMHRIVHNACLMKIRRKKVRPESSIEDIAPHGEQDRLEPLNSSGSVRLPDRCFADQELGRAIAQAIDALPANYREIVELADVKQLSMKEVAQALDLSVPNAKSRLHRARLKLRASLAPYLEAEPYKAAM